MTKSFTAAAVLRLRDEGRLHLDDPAAKHVPAATGLRPSTSDSPAITLRHLLSMSAGLATDDPWADRHLDVAPPDLLRWLHDGASFAAAPGTVFEYSNLGYGILGQVVEAAAGMRLRTTSAVTSSRRSAWRTRSGRRRGHGKARGSRVPTGWWTAWPSPMPSRWATARSPPWAGSGARWPTSRCGSPSSPTRSRPATAPTTGRFAVPRAARCSR